MATASAAPAAVPPALYENACSLAAHLVQLVVPEVGRYSVLCDHLRVRKRIQGDAPRGAIYAVRRMNTTKPPQISRERDKLHARTDQITTWCHLPMLHEERFEVLESVLESQHSCCKETEQTKATLHDRLITAIRRKLARRSGRVGSERAQVAASCVSCMMSAYAPAFSARSNACHPNKRLLLYMSARTSRWSSRSAFSSHNLALTSLVRSTGAR